MLESHFWFMFMRVLLLSIIFISINAAVIVFILTFIDGIKGYRKFKNEQKTKDLNQL